MGSKDTEPILMTTRYNSETWLQYKYWREKYNLKNYQKIVNEALPGIYIDRKCQRELMNELLEIQKQIPIKFTGHLTKDKLEQCNKRTD